MDPFDTSPLSNLFHCDVGAAAGTRRSVSDFAGVCLGASEKLLKTIPRRVALDHYPKKIASDADDIGKVPGWVIRCLSQKRCPEDWLRDLRNSVAVRFCSCGHLRWPER